MGLFKLHAIPEYGTDRYAVYTESEIPVGMITESIDKQRTQYCSVLGLADDHTALPGYSKPFIIHYTDTLDEALEWLTAQALAHRRRLQVLTLMYSDEISTHITIPAIDDREDIPKERVVLHYVEDDDLDLFIILRIDAAKQLAIDLLQEIDRAGKIK